MAGAPKGNKNAHKGRRATMALERAIDIRDGKATMPESEAYSVLVEMWNVQIDKALEGDNGSHQLVVERLDGKARQAMDLDASITVTDATQLTDVQLANIASSGGE